VLVNFVVVTDGGGSVFAGAAQTNADGEARERWTLGPVAGEHVVEARAVDQTTGDPIVFGRITATALPGPITALSLSSGSRKLFLGQSLDLATMVRDAHDEFWNPVENPPLTLEVPPPFTKEGTTVSSEVETKGSARLVSGTASALVEVTVVRHLSPLVGATGGWACAGIRNSLDGTMTRLEVDFVVDSVAYPALAQGFTLGEALIWVTRSDTRTWKDGSTSVTGPTVEGLAVYRQEPGLLVSRWVGPNPAAVGGLGSLQDVAQSSADPLSYLGGSQCDSHWFVISSFEPLTITR
jgi:hypothetical protein